MRTVKRSGLEQFEVPTQVFAELHFRWQLRNLVSQTPNFTDLDSVFECYT